MIGLFEVISSFEQKSKPNLSKLIVTKNNLYAPAGLNTATNSGRENVDVANMEDLAGAPFQYRYQIWPQVSKYIAKIGLADTRLVAG